MKEKSLGELSQEIYKRKFDPADAMQEYLAKESLFKQRYEYNRRLTGDVQAAREALRSIGQL
mgnify:CR=1 FL=1